ncbi:autotransporter-associated beta strand repeat-containing protein, partial [Enterobacter hormaechei]|uniref:autotransporter-associated beta strand repeat-containing protein n=1 Tax=Enterobacter hormaechei TaxID=158836 RepID=UPI001952FC92
GTVNLGANSIEVGGATNGTFSGSIAGTGGLTKVGAGIETLTGANTYTGGTFINACTLAIGPGGSLADSGAVTLSAAGTGFDISTAGASQTIGSLNGVAGSTVSLGAQTLTLGGVGNSLFDGAISGTGGLVKNGAGILTLGGANLFSGGVALNGGGLVVGNNAALGSG